MQRRIRRRQTQGLNARVFIATELAYSTEPTFKDFVDNAVSGEIGVFVMTPAMNAETEATIKANALAVGDKYFIAQKHFKVKDGQTEVITKKTPIASYIEVRNKHREPFCAPVKQITHVGYNGTDGDIADVVPVVNIGDNYGLSIIESTEGYQPYPTWQYEHTATVGQALEDVLDKILSSINNDNSVTNKENEPIVNAELLYAGVATALAGGPATLSAVYGSNVIVASGAGHGLVANDFVRIGGTSTSGVYKVKSVNGVNIELTGAFVGTTGAGIAGFVMTVPTNLGIQFTSREFGLTFEVALKEFLSDSLVRLTTPFKEGCGYDLHIENLEYEGQIFDGTTTVNAKFKKEWGEQDDLRVATLAYDVSQLDLVKVSESKALRNSDDSQYSYVIIAAPITVGASLPYVNAAVSPRATLNTVFGL